MEHLLKLSEKEYAELIKALYFSDDISSELHDKIFEMPRFYHDSYFYGCTGYDGEDDYDPSIAIETKDSLGDTCQINIAAGKYYTSYEINLRTEEPELAFVQDLETGDIFLPAEPELGIQY